ncbi:MAG TPA: hypothetical protein VJO36_09905, partial [Actinomycetota bacterium]|nr:hypothetical protein [Actinomycetota bacterium]
MQDLESPQDLVPIRHGHRARRRANWGFRIGLVLILLIAGLVFAGLRYYDWCQEASGPRTPVPFEVAKGAS